MTCSDLQRLIFAQRDGSLALNQQACLEEHVAKCPECAQLRNRLTDTVGAWRRSTASVRVPDETQAWYALRRKLRHEKPPGWFNLPKPRTLAWIGVPTAAIAALAFAFYTPRSAGPTPGETSSESALAARAPAIARADFVEVPGNSASTMVYVDNTSGWLVVWADPGKG